MRNWRCTYLPYAFNKWAFNDVDNVKQCKYCKRFKASMKYGNFCSKRCKNDHELEKRQIFKHNNRCIKHKFEMISYNGRCFSCLIDEEKSACLPYRACIPLSFRMKMWFNNFTLLPTFRSSKSSWGKDKLIFEEFLKKEKIYWFVYVKFYVSKWGSDGYPKQIKPLVVGKSGSKLVNSSGSDVNFSIDLKDGPAREFLHYEGKEWFHGFIAVKSLKSESKSYKCERNLLRKWNLFGS